METVRPPGRVPRACGAAVAAIGAAALIGWTNGQPILLGFRARYIPMAPNTALAFLTLGAGLAVVAGPGRWWRRLSAGLAAPVILVVTLRLFEYATGADLAVDHLFLQVPAARFGLAPVGKMALATAAAFLAAGAAMATLAGAPRPGVVRDLAGWLALIVAATGLVFTLGYLFSPDAPLLYGTQSIPMALNTAIGFVLLGAGLVAAAGPGASPFNRLAGPSIRARLLRVFLPLVVGTVGVVAWLTHVVTKTAGPSSTAISSAALATGAIALFSALCERVARRLGRQLERAEAGLQRARDELEVKVEERTGELARAFGELQASHAALARAHDELKQAQGRMLQQAKLASLGQTAAGVAHEINNPLAYVASNIAVLRRDVVGLHEILSLYRQAEQTPPEDQLELHGRIRDLAEEVDLPYVLDNLLGLMDRSRDGLKRIQKIVEGLRDFAHLEEADFEEADLNAGIAAMVDLMRGPADGRGVVLEADLAPIPRLACYPAKISMTVQNLVSNAIDACDPGGRVVVATRPAGGGVEIAVSDDGRGIDPSIGDRIFDPFFTTKPIGQGTGLGLAMSYGIVKDHGGTIDFESAPGRGTRFVVRLPAGHLAGRQP